MGGEFKRIDVKKWRGLNEDENPAVLEEGELSVAENVWRYGRMIGTRPGTQYEPETSDWDAKVEGAAALTACQGLHDCSATYDSVRYLLAIFNGLAWIDHTVLTGVRGLGGCTITAGDDYLWTFAEHNNRVYAAGGNTAIPDSVWYWIINPPGANLVPVVFQNAAVANIGAEYIFEKWNRLWINGMHGTGVDDGPMIGRYSALNDGTSWPVANTIGGTSAIGGLSAFGDEYSTGWGSYQDNRGDFLLFLTNKRIYAIIQDVDPAILFRVSDTISTGCVSQRAFVDLGVDSGDAVYLSEQGIHSLRQSQIHGNKSNRYLSWKIRKTFASLNKTRLKYATGAYWPEHGIVIFAVPTGSNAFNSLLLILDVRDADTEDGLTADNVAWYVGYVSGTDHNPQMLIQANDRTTEQQYIYGGNRKGDIFRFTTSNFSDMGEPYNVHIRTRHADFDAPGVTKIPGNIEVWIQSNGKYSVNMNWVYDLGDRFSSNRIIRLENPGITIPFVLDDTAVLGSGVKLQRKVEYGTGHGETIANDFQNSSANQPFWIARVTQQVAGLGDELGDVDS